MSFDSIHYSPAYRNVDTPILDSRLGLRRSGRGWRGDCTSCQYLDACIVTEKDGPTRRSFASCPDRISSQISPKPNGSTTLLHIVDYQKAPHVANRQILALRLWAQTRSAHHHQYRPTEPHRGCLSGAGTTPPSRMPHPCYRRGSQRVLHGAQNDARSTDRRGGHVTGTPRISRLKGTGPMTRTFARLIAGGDR